MENLEPDRRSKLGVLNNNKKINPKSLSLKNKLPVQKKIDESATCKSNDTSNGFGVMKHFLNEKNSASPSSTGISNDVASSSKDDSLKDFRSPARETDMNESLTDFKISVPSKRLVLKESKQIVKNKKERNRKVVSNVKQPSIESSFFKPKTEVQTAFLCPLCFKSYKETTARTNHMKSCAARNNLSTKQLLDAVELQEKQANERKAMGLLVAPPVQPKKTISRKMISEKDPQLQLALALSMSLHEAQISEEIEEAHLLEGEPFFPINGEISEERRKTLQNFGFTTNKPAVAAYASNKSRKKRPAGPTVLQTRTQEERDRITTVRIAEVLMGDERVTQAMQHNGERFSQVNKNIDLKSRLLRSYHRVEDRLWDRTQQTMNGQNLYPCNTLESSPPKVKSESKIDKTEQNSAEQKNSKKCENNLPSTTPDQNIVSDRLNSESSSESSIDDDTVIVKSKVDKDSFMDLSKDWRSMLGASYMSDVLVVVKGDHTICAHQVVFWARCYSMINDVTKNDPDRFWELKHRILWPETELGSAYAFLEFIYCGSIERHESIFNCAELLAGVRALARKYQVKKLFVYLRDKSNELKINSLKNPNKSASVTKISSKSKPANNSDDSLSLPSRTVSICSKETDIHSRSTECSDLLTDKQGIEKEIFDKDNVCRRLIEEQEKENILSRSSLKVNTSTSANTFSDTRMSRGIPTSIGSTFIDTKSNESLSKNVSTSSIKDFYATQDDDFLKVVNDQIFERERSVSPDMFDDSETENAACSYSVSKKLCNVPDYGTNSSDADIELLCSSKEDKETEGEILNKEINLLDREISVAEISNEEENCEIVKKPKVDLRFVSTRRTRKNIENSLSPDFNSDIDDLNHTKSLSGSFKKKKGDITMAIEKIQKLNAKTVSESDSESELVETYKTKKRKNPFRLNITQSSSVIEENINPELDVDDVPRRRRNKLSIFEKKIEISAAKNPTMFNLPAHLADLGSKNTKLSDNSKSTASTSGLENVKLQNENNKRDDESIIELSQKPVATPNDSDDSVFDLTQGSSRESMLDSDKDTCDTNPDDKDLSMFAKYKRKHSRNSIDKYRVALRNASLATSVSSSKCTGGDLSFDDSLDLKNGVNSIAHSSKYEYTDPNQSTSNFQRELASMSSESSPKIFSSEESEEREKSSVKFCDAELSDLDIDLADFSSLRYSDKLNESRANGRSQGEHISLEKSSDDIFDDEKTFDNTPEKIVDVPVCASNVKLEDTKIKVARSNLSDEDTETECWIESVLPKNEKRSVTDKEKSTDIHDEETDTEEMGDRGLRSKPSCSKSELNLTSTDVSKEMRKSESLVEDCLERSSPECEITGMFLSTSINFDFVKDVSDEVGLLLEECKTSNSKRLHNLSSMSQAHSSSGLGISDPFASTPKNNRVVINDYSNFTPDNVANDYDDDNFLANKSLPEAHCSNTESRREKSVNVEDRKNCSKASAKKKYDFSDSDSSECEDFKICKTKSKKSISSGNKSEVMEKVSRSISLRCKNTPPENNSTPLRSLKMKSVSENILKSKPMDKINFMDNSYDGKSKSTGTQSVDPKISKKNNQTTPQRGSSSENVTPLADYSAMNTPELRKELGKYGFKPQKRHRAKQLLRYIYNELHPLVPVAGSNIPSYSNVSSSDDDMPAPKRLNKSKSLDAINHGTCEDDAESNPETLALDPRTESDASDDNEFENYDLYQLSQSDNTKNLETAFRQLIEVDKDLHNKILTYQPLKLEELHSMLKSQGIKCKLDSLMNFLDEQCITFRQMTNAKKSRTKRKLSPKKNSNTLGKGINLKK